MTFMPQRKNVVTCASTILLILLELGLQTSGLQHYYISPITFNGRQPISFQHQSTCIWPSSSSTAAASVSDEVVVDDTLDDLLLSEDQTSQIIGYYYDWDEQFEELQSFMSRYGHCNFPQNASNELTNKYPS